MLDEDEDHLIVECVDVFVCLFSIILLQLIGKIYYKKYHAFADLILTFVIGVLHSYLFLTFGAKKNVSCWIFRNSFNARCARPV